MCYEDIKIKYGKDYLAIRKSHHPDLHFFFEPLEYKIAQFSNHVTLNKEGLHGLIQSSSFMPRTADAVYPAMAKEIDDLYDTFNENGVVKIKYETHVHYGV